jgi:hypothetical protein
MVQKSSEFSTQQLGQHLAKSLGQPLSEQELSNCCKQIEINSQVQANRSGRQQTRLLASI